MKQTNPLPRQPGVPYTMQEILMERIQFEDRVNHPYVPTQPTPVKKLPPLKRTITSTYVMAKQMYRFSLSLARP